jgi:hypothetical protein
MEYQPLSNAPAGQQLVPAVQAYNFVKDSEYDPYDNISSRSSLRLAILLLVVTCPAFALVPGLLSEWYLGIVGCLFSLIQLAIAVMACLSQGRSNGIGTARIAFLIYTFVILAAVLVYEGWSLQDRVRHNWSHCEDYVMYTVCRKRGGLMTTDLILVIFYPFIDFLILACCVYVLRCLRNRHRSLQRQER